MGELQKTGASDATARFLEGWLQREYPGTVWEVSLEASQDGVAPETAPWVFFDDKREDD